MNGCQVPGVKLDRPVTGSHKYGGHVLQVGGWAWGWQPHPVQILLSGNPKKATAHKRLSCRWWWWYKRNSGYQNHSHPFRIIQQVLNYVLLKMTFREVLLVLELRPLEELQAKYQLPNNFHISILLLNRCFVRWYAKPQMVHIIFISSDHQLNDSPDDRDSTHLWNVGQLQCDYTALHPRRL
jgi:hypothetical protein